ncbi:MAG TPA: adenine deaminase, partial [Ruminococcaceae bacterium]|nr:adenine deaminase [Oscillospiraceae bacterium]
MDRKQKQRLIPYALQQKLPELVLKNAGVVDVFSKRVRKADVAIQDGVIVGVGDCRGREERDLGGAFVAPGFIDSHVHIESSMVSPPLFAEKILAHGTTAVVADPHEIVNVAGGAGMEYMLSQTENAGVRFYFMLPSCVPISSIEHNGAVFGADRMRRFRGHPRVLGLGEVMDCPGVLRGDGGLLEKIGLMEGGVIDGHAPAVRGRELQAYRLAGVQTDHECTDYAQA